MNEAGKYSEMSKVNGQRAVPTLNGKGDQPSLPWPTSLVLICLLVGILFIPIAVAIRKGGMHAVFSFFTSDTFYYFTVATHSTPPFFSFDGTTTTNGFHPMWGFLISLLPKEGFVVSVFTLSLFFVSAGLVLTGIAIQRFVHV